MQYIIIEPRVPRDSLEPLSLFLVRVYFSKDKKKKKTPKLHAFPKSPASQLARLSLKRGRIYVGFTTWAAQSYSQSQ